MVSIGGKGEIAMSKLRGTDFLPCIFTSLSCHPRLLPWHGWILPGVNWPLHNLSLVALPAGPVKLLSAVSLQPATATATLLLLHLNDSLQHCLPSPYPPVLGHVVLYNSMPRLTFQSCTLAFSWTCRHKSCNTLTHGQMTTTALSCACLYVLGMQSCAEEVMWTELAGHANDMQPLSVIKHHVHYICAVVPRNRHLSVTFLCRSVN